MRCAITCINDETVEVRLRNISSMGAQVESPIAVSPGTAVTIDIIGVGAVQGTVCWAQLGKFGVQFADEFDLARLAPKRDRRKDEEVTRPWYVERRVG